MSESNQQRGKMAWLDLVSMLPYIEINGKITENNLDTILTKLDIHIDNRQLKVKGIWHMFKQFHVYNIDQPIFFIKELWQPEFFREILGLHVAIHFLDAELCPKQYMFGVWKQQSKEKPILITTYVKGQSLKKNQYQNYLHELGRQHALHQILSLYDVDWRHFIVQQGLIARIDFGKSFENMNIPYQGFWDLRWNELKNNPAFRDGINLEFNRIKQNLAVNRKHLAYLLEKIDAIGSYKNFFIDFDLYDFMRKLRSYWKNYLPFIIV